MGFTERGDWSQEAGGAIGRPIVEDKIGFRASGYYRQDGGYIDRVPFYANRGTSEENSNSRDTSGRQRSVHLRADRGARDGASRVELEAVAQIAMVGWDARVLGKRAAERIPARHDQFFVG